MGRRSFPGGIITSTELTVTGYGASGMWSTQTAAQKKNSGLWPIPGITPSGPVVGPTIANVSVTDSSYNVINDTPYIDSAGGYIKISGTGFASGAVVYVGGSAAVTTSFVSSTEVRAQVAAGTTSNAFPVYVVNTDSSVAIKLAAVTYSGLPSWSTAATLSDQVVDSAFSIALSATGDSAITYSLAAGSTLPPGTALSSGGVFSGTVTGLSVDTAYSFSVVANDAENQDSSRTFTVNVSIGDQYFYLTPLLLNGEANVWITDSSTNKFLPTITGDTRPVAFSPYNTTWSVYFNGASYLDVAASTTFNEFLLADYTIECWFYYAGANFTSGPDILSVATTWSTSVAYNLEVRSGGAVYFHAGDSIPITLISSGGQLVSVYTWNHVAAVRYNGVTTLYVNGANAAASSTSVSISKPAQAMRIGAFSQDGLQKWTGYISNVRVVKGQAAYTANFTPSTTSISTTSQGITSANVFLGCSTNRFIDANTTPKTITVGSGAPLANTFTPFADTDTTTGSGYFDGTGDYLTVAASNSIDLSTGDFTVETWAYPTTTTNSVDSVFGYGTYTLMMYHSSTTWTVELGNGSSNYFTLTGTAPLNAWSHFAITRSGSTFTFWINGVSASTNSTASAIALSSKVLYIGLNFNSSIQYFTGYISDFRIIKGTVQYTANFTPPTSLLSAVTNTSLLTLQYRRGDNNHRFVDESGVRALTTRAGNAHQGSFSPFSPAGWSAYFNGSSYLNAVSNAAFAFGTGDFTLEAWIFLPVYPSAGTIAGQIITAHNWTGGTIDFGWRVNTAGPLYFEATGGANLTSTIVVPLGQWNHVACVRSSGTITFYINGLSRGSASITTSIPSTTAVSLGHSLTGGTYGALTGYISNARVVKGVAVYTANFTPQTTSLTSTQSAGTNIAAITAGQTSLLTLQDNNFKDNSSNAFALTNGSSKIQAFSPFRPSAAYTPATHGGSAYFDGSGDYVYITNSPAMTLGTNNHCIEFWMYPDGTQAIYSVPWYYNGSIVYYFSVGSNSNESFLLVGGGSPWTLAITVLSTEYLKVLNNWTHVAITRSGTAFRVIFNGRLVGYGTASQSISAQTSAFSIGWDGTNATTYYKGWLSNFRVINGSIPTAYQTASTTLGTTIFTPPTSVPAFEANTVMTMNFTNGGIVDASGRHTFETVGDAKISNVASKFGLGSLYFDGTGDYLSAPATALSDFGTGDFTIEFWMNASATGTYVPVVGTQSIAGSSTAGMWRVSTRLNSVNGIYFNYTTGSAFTDVTFTTTNYNDGAWHHVAVVRTSNVLKAYVDGTKVGSDTAITQSLTSGQKLFVGFQAQDSVYYTGYVDDLRITRFARYTGASLTVPTGPFLTK